MASYLSTSTSFSRLLADPHLVTETLGAKMTEVEDATPLPELVAGVDYDELVEQVKASLESGFARAEQQLAAYQPYCNMVQHDQQLDLPALKEAYVALRKSLTGGRWWQQ